jgi:glycosyltransferase involved in cell wall biosynthesis
MADCSISIIIPAYNVEKYLKAALDSIKEQTELPDEVILIDDGSTDGTLDVANAFEFPVPYQVVSIENGGQGNARNLGVSLASSEYVYFFDSDDLLTVDCIKFLKAQIRKNKSPDIILFSGKSFNDKGYFGPRCEDFRRGFSGYFDNRIDLLDKGLEHGGLSCSPCLYLSKRSLWGGQKLVFGSDFLEDDALFFPLLFSCRSFFVFDVVMFLRRNRHGSTMTMPTNIKHVRGALNCINSSLHLLETEGFTLRERWHIRKRLEGYCISYVVSSRKLGFSLQFNKLALVIIKVKSLKLILRVVYYGVLKRL